MTQTNSPKNKNRILVLGILTGFVLATGAMLASGYMIAATNKETFCVSCHAMKPFRSAWKKSKHGMCNAKGLAAQCTDCHLPHDGLINYVTTKAYTGARDIINNLISEYANTQNKVSASDFFSNHPFHIRIEGFSRRKYVPAKEGEQRETKWFYERARGQYADELSKLKKAEQRRFKAENPRNQMFTKTDLAKFENVWDEHPRWVCLGAQKNFAQFAKRIGKAWILSQDFFNEFFYQRLIARGIIFRRTEKLVSAQPWYDGGYRAQTVANTLAVISEICKRNKVAIDYLKIWNKQEVYPSRLDATTITSKRVNDDIIHPPEGISNIGEWCKKEGCWTRLQSLIPELETSMPKAFWDDTVSLKEQAAQVKDAKTTQKIDDGINVQKTVVEIPASTWADVLTAGMKGKFLSPKEANLLRIAQQIPMKIPSEKQCKLLVAILEKAQKEGVALQ